VLLLAAALCACQTAETPRPAVLVRADAQTLEALKSALADALGVAHVELGAGDLTRTSAIPVLPSPPSPLEGRSPAMPILYDLAVRGEDCLAIARGSGEEIALRGVSCRPL